MPSQLLIDIKFVDIQAHGMDNKRFCTVIYNQEGLPWSMRNVMP